MWDECGIGLCPIDHVKRCEIFTRLHHFDIFLRFFVVVGVVGYLCFSLPATCALVCVCVCLCVCRGRGGVH